MDRSPGLGVPYWGVLPPTLRSSSQQPPKPHQSAHVIPHLMLMATRPACELGLSQMQWFIQHSVGAISPAASLWKHPWLIPLWCVYTECTFQVSSAEILVWGLIVCLCVSFFIKGKSLGKESEWLPATQASTGRAHMDRGPGGPPRREMLCS